MRTEAQLAGDMIWMLDRKWVQGGAGGGKISRSDIFRGKLNLKLSFYSAIKIKLSGLASNHL